MTTQTMTAQTFAALPPIRMETSSPSHPLKSLLMTVFVLKILVAAFLIATVSLAPPVSADAHYTTLASN
ncbi:hypothetical protein MOV61_21940 [Neorhizobium sp. BETTINA12A]|uniref:hypothetical protein n=1 Tax=Neorhizobium sp. BETTINA12A TaxID=2908924 RepID=UPI001FF594D1|nr:hypothetical protein [Neorhizobium sp. BETTINA12A]MCJ9753385.1 hypothetical protein [Neorhizobium sp. BETTINA12A]